MIELNEREIRILELVAIGTSYGDIAQEIDVSESMVKLIMRDVRTKLEVDSTHEALMKAVKEGLLNS